MSELNSFAFPDDLHGFHIHFVGIKGTGMAALVEICAARGAVITGSDVPDYFYTDDILAELHIQPSVRFVPENISADVKLVVYSSAYKRDSNPELVEADRRGIPVLLYSEALGAFSAGAYSCGIAGVHGKTTTTGLAGTVIRALQIPAQVLAGSRIASFGDAAHPGGSCTCSCGHTYFVAETCEYQRHFMSFHPRKIILTSVESDHQDFYPTYADIRQAFIDYICLLPPDGTLVYCADDPGAAETAAMASAVRPDIRLVPYGFTVPPDSPDRRFRIVSHYTESEKQHFTLDGCNTTFTLRIPGLHTVLDAVAAVALAVELYREESGSGKYSGGGLDPDAEKKIAEALYSYAGSKRRSEITGSLKHPDVVFIDDYGHHPTAVQTTLAGYRDFYPDRQIIVDFMSHTYSRTAALLDAFSTCFGAADEVILHKIYSSAREKAADFAGTVSGKILAERTAAHHPNVRYFEEVLDAAPYAAERLLSPLPPGKKGWLFVTMGAGDNWKLTAAVSDILKAQGSD